MPRPLQSPLAFQPAYVGGGSAANGNRAKLQSGARHAETATLFHGRWKDRLLQNASRRLLKLMLHMAADESRPALTERHLEFAQLNRYTSGGHYGWHADRQKEVACVASALSSRCARASRYLHDVWPTVVPLLTQLGMP